MSTITEWHVKMQLKTCPIDCDQKTDATVKLSCPLCGAEHTVTASKKRLLRWAEGELAQRALPDLSDNQREQLITGFCPKCIEATYAMYEKEEEE